MNGSADSDFYFQQNVNNNMIYYFINYIISVNIFGDEDKESSPSSGGDSVDGSQDAGHMEIKSQSSCQSVTFKNKIEHQQYKIEKFYKSIKSRLIVAEVIKR